MTSEVKKYQGLRERTRLVEPGRFDKLMLKPDLILSDDEPTDEENLSHRTYLSESHDISSDEDNKSSHKTKSLKDKLNKAERALSPELLKSEEKRLKWNAYMKKYNERKRKEREERLNYVSINFRNNAKLYKVDDINTILINFITFIEELFNINAERFDPKIVDEINANNNDIVKYCELLYDAIVQIL